MDVIGVDVMGNPMAVVGYTEDGQAIVVGAGAPRGRHARRQLAPHGASNLQVHRPEWREPQLAPGVIAPDEGLLPLTLSGAAGNVFSATLQTITFTGRLQKPFRGERLLVSTVRTGATAVGRLIGQLFVGTDLQQAAIAGFDLEQVGANNAFGVRLTMTPAQPGVDISIVTTLTTALTGTDTIVTTVTILGRIVH
jgi:hypothetical protein